MKTLVLLLLFVSIQFSIQISNAFGQACGASTRTISLKSSENAGQAPVNAAYELFYLAPKKKISGKKIYESYARFLSQFLYDDPNARNGNLWRVYDHESPFVTVPAEKAENHIRSYRLADYRYLYTNRWRDNHLAQLKGNFIDGVLKLETRETDVTPFIMRITAEKHETAYFLSNFLGGCFRDQEVATIQLKPIKK